VWSLAKRPSEALRSWLDPRELVRLGAAVRHRTSHLFDGMFDPAPPPPEQASDARELSELPGAPSPITAAPAPSPITASPALAPTTAAAAPSPITPEPDTVDRRPTDDGDP
jgi:hypothetical protein